MIRDGVQRIRGIKIKLLFLFIYGVIIVTAFFLGLPCIWRFLLGFPCPGCGMTRAFFSVLRGDFAAAFTFHPMVFTLPVFLLYYLYDGRPFQRTWMDRVVFWGICAGFLAQWVYKLATGF